MKGQISSISDSAAAHQTSLLVASEPKRITAYTIEIDIIEKQKRIYYFAKRMVKSMTPLDDADELADLLGSGGHGSVIFRPCSSSTITIV